MCIRDSYYCFLFIPVLISEISGFSVSNFDQKLYPSGSDCCLLYTSDAADERSSVDLGGRRIIKKKNTYKHARISTTKYKMINIWDDIIEQKHI